MRLMSGSGPAGPIFHGVWQSLQPATVTRYLPRAERLGIAIFSERPMSRERCSEIASRTASSRSHGTELIGSWLQLLVGVSDFSVIQRSSSDERFGVQHAACRAAAFAFADCANERAR